MRSAFLFPGQGSQTVGMGRELVDKFPIAAQTFLEADQALGFSLSKLCFEGPEEQLRMTAITQPAILTVSVAAYRVLTSKSNQLPDAMAGHSLGEYSAHVAAGTFTFADAVRTVHKRGQFMQEAVPAGDGAMAAILGLELSKVEDVCREAEGRTGATVAPANINSATQVVISGASAAVECAAGLARERGAKSAKMLPVSAPFHCELMRPAQQRLERELMRIAFADPKIPLVTNVDVSLISTAEEARDTLVRQVTGAVRWAECIGKLLSEGVERFIEVGPGKVLCGLMRRIDRPCVCTNVEDEASLEKSLALPGS